MNTGITLTCTWGRAPLVASKVPQVAYLLIEAQAAAIAEKMPLNFCLVLDRSGSMQGRQTCGAEGCRQTGDRDPDPRRTLLRLCCSTTPCKRWFLQRLPPTRRR
jgi:hypothetical protein